MRFNWTDIAEVFVSTALIAYLITPLIRMVALRTGYLDHPKGNKVHAHPTPLLGGLSMYIAFMVGIFTTVKLAQDPRIYHLMTAATFLLIVGLVDDRMGMLPEIKLLAQFLAAMTVVKAGIRIEFLNNYYLNTVVSYLWIVGITNSFNLLDNMNGLSAGIAAIAAVFFGIVMWSSGQLSIAILAFALAGAALGFLRHNFPRARIFMGDTGSLILGFLLASIAIMGSWSTRFLTTSLAMPILILAYPIFDTTLVMVMRLIEGRSVFQGGKDHSSHRLALLGLKKKRAVLVIYGVCVVLGVSAIMVQHLALRPALGVIVCTGLFLLAVGIRLAMVDTGRFGRNRKAKDAGDE